MKKLKTHKATAKRLRIKRSRKGTTILKRTEGQDHFNTRENGKTRRNKRSDKHLPRGFHQTIIRAMPHA